MSSSPPPDPHATQDRLLELSRRAEGQTARRAVDIECSGVHRSGNNQLSEALESRVLIEQAKGMVAERTGSSIEAAFDRLRHHARSNNRRLTDVAADVVVGVLAPLNLARLPRE